MIKQITVISGKGGTGKTSIVGSLAYLADNNVLVDCDVDAADLHLILNGKTDSPEEFIGGEKAEINPEICMGCGMCMDLCRFGAVKTKGVNPVIYDLPGFEIDKNSCEGCGVCVEFCPDKAIELKETKSGDWFFTDTKYGPLFHARLGIAEANSGRLVSLLRNKAYEYSKDNNFNTIIIDGPPGIGCPVIASLTGVDYVLIITEPTASAIHDMKRIIELTKHFRIVTGICINKFDLNESLAEYIRKIANDNNLKVLASIPYDTAVTKAQIKGIPYPEYKDNGITKHFQNLWRNLKIEISKPDMIDNNEVTAKQFEV